MLCLLYTSAIHGSAVVANGRAVVMLGRSGQGKSTLAAALCAREGVALLSDDAVAIDPATDAAADGPHGYLVTGLEQQHWLDADARAAIGGTIDNHDGKRPMNARATGDRGRLIAFIELGWTEGPTRLVRLSPLQAMAALVPQAVRFILDEPQVHRREIDVLTHLIDRVPVFRLERPQTLTLLSESCGRVLEILSAEPPSEPRQLR